MSSSLRVPTLNSTTTETNKWNITSPEPNNKWNGGIPEQWFARQVKTPSATSADG
jgi:hypothetical protein